MQQAEAEETEEAEEAGRQRRRRRRLQQQANVHGAGAQGNERGVRIELSPPTRCLILSNTRIRNRQPDSQLISRRNSRFASRHIIFAPSLSFIVGCYSFCTSYSLVFSFFLAYRLDASYVRVRG
jgi:hypothetical protein